MMPSCPKCGRKLRIASAKENESVYLKCAKACAKQPLLDLKARVLDALRAVPLPQDNEGRTLADVHNKIQCKWTGRRSIRITGRGTYALIIYGGEIQQALEAAGLKVYYGLHIPQTEGKWVGSVTHYYIDVPLDQETGPFGYDCS